VLIVFWTLGLLLRRRYRVVHAHEEAVFFLRFLKPIFRFKLVYDMHSSLPEQLRNYRFTTSRLLIGMFEWLENSCLRKADAVITICPELARYALPRMPDPSRHFLIENSIFEPVRLARPKEATPAIALPPIPQGRRIVLYAGTFEVYQGLDTLIRAFARAWPTCEEALLLLVGGTTSQVEAMQAIAAQEGVGAHVLVLPRQPQAVVAGLVSRASVLVSPRSHGSNTPLKIYEQLASGIPLVATRILSHTQVLSDEVCFLVEPTPDSMAEGLVAALTDPPAAGRVVANAKRLYETAYARPIYEQKLASLLARIGAAKRPGAAALAEPIGE
jgi:glycosyltransferase involved in cell wall biosynthesis